MTLLQSLNRLWKKHIIDAFPYPPWCFDCDKGSCEGCEMRGEET